MEAVVVAGVEYSELVMARGDKMEAIKEGDMEEEGEEEEVEYLGASHVMIGCRYILALGIEEKVTEPTRMMLTEWWTSKIAGRTEDQIAKELQTFKCKKPQKTSTNKKGKKAPKGSLEWEAQRLLNTFKIKK